MFAMLGTIAVVCRHPAVMADYDYQQGCGWLTILEIRVDGIRVAPRSELWDELLPLALVAAAKEVKEHA